jgi:hypothetical protein
MKTITHKKLMEKLEDGTIEVHAWTGITPGSPVYVDATIHPPSLRARSIRKEIEVTNVPADFASLCEV